MVLKEGIQPGAVIPTDTRTILLREHIHDFIVACLDGQDALMLEMYDECGTDGVLGFLWLKDKYGGGSTASTVTTLIGILSATIGFDVPAGARQIVADNKLLPVDMQLSDAVVSCLVIAKLPASYSTLRDILIQQDSLCSPGDLVKMIDNRAKIVGSADDSRALVATNRDQLGCLNCGGTHATTSCPNVCSECKTSYCGVFLPGPGKAAVCPTIAPSSFPDRIYNATKRSIPLRMYEVLKQKWESNKENKSKALMARAEEQFLESFDSEYKQ